MGANDPDEVSTVVIKICCGWSAAGRSVSEDVAVEVNVGGVKEWASEGVSVAVLTSDREAVFGNQSCPEIKEVKIITIIAIIESEIVIF